MIRISRVGVGWGFAFFWGLFIFAFNVAWIGTLIYIAMHFLRKFW